MQWNTLFITGSVIPISLWLEIKDTGYVYFTLMLQNVTEITV